MLKLSGSREVVGSNTLASSLAVASALPPEALRKLNVTTEGAPDN